MDAEKMQKLEAERTRLHEKHQREWNEISEESLTALSKTKSVREMKRIRQENQRKMDLLLEKQKDELINFQRAFVEALKSR